MGFYSLQQKRPPNWYMKLLANENFPKKSVLYLRDKGFDVSSIGMDNPSIQDHAVMTIAIREDRTILTFDRDYGELIFKFNYRPKRGVIYLRLNEYKADEPGKIIEDLILKKEFNFDNALTVFDKNAIRQRKY
jgi:predicted nuclease of predicted toxin-antitoxin system